MVRNASRTLKIGMHSPFNPDFDVGSGTFNPKNFGRPNTYVHTYPMLFSKN